MVRLNKLWVELVCVTSVPWVLLCWSIKLLAWDSPVLKKLKCIHSYKMLEPPSPRMAEWLWGAQLFLPHNRNVAWVRNVLSHWAFSFDLLPHTIDWNLQLLTPRFTCWNLPLSVMAFRHAALGRWLGSWEHERDYYPYKSNPRLLPHFSAMGGHSKTHI